LVYPAATIFLIWAVSGHSGPAETALGLKLDLPGWRRGIALVLLAACAFSERQYIRSVRDLQRSEQAAGPDG